MIGRTRELAAVEEALQVGASVVLWGPPGIGRSSIAAAATERSRPAVGHALASLSFRPYLVLESALGASAPAVEQDEVAAWAAQLLGSRVLVAEDVHLAHPATIAVLGRLAARTTIVMTATSGHPNSDAVAAALDRWGVLAPRPVDVAPLDGADARELVVGLAPAMSESEVDEVIRSSAGIPAWLVAAALRRHDERSGSVLQSMDVAVRTALVVAAVLARPAAPELLGPGVDGLVACGAASIDGAGRLVAVSALARAALERVPLQERRRVHELLAERLPDRAEAARHLAAAGRPSEAAALAIDAAGRSTTVEERAAHLDFAATVEPEPATIVDAVGALLLAGDLASATRWVPRLDLAEPAQALLTARVHRFAGAVAPAREAVGAGLAAARPGTSVWRRLLVEAAWSGAGAVPQEQVLTSCTGTPEEAAASVACALGSGGLLASPDGIDLTALEPPERFHVGLQAARSLLRSGDGDAAVRMATTVAQLAHDDGFSNWGSVAQIESAWCRYLLCGDADAIDEVTRLLGGLLSAQARDRARALLHLGTVDRDPIGAVDERSPSPSELWAAISAEASLAVDDLERATVSSAIAGVPPADPVTSLLSGPVAVTASARWGVPAVGLAAFPLLEAEAAALAAGDERAVVEVADQWRDVAVRGVVRCLLHSGAAGAKERAAEIATEAGLLRWAARAGAQSVRGDGVLTGRERQILELVAAGCTTPMISRRLGIADSTTESHIKSAKSKLGVSTRAGAVARLR
ncbi:LuxR C-terminal-related transcriptional regulator [Dermatobacter hominis]|uniref:LuxR C-terminal-related transcriptional regulator n=1 Tax=Dermatobacter hominis TaxID=2884263 RepID=UPI001D125003|nr:LuxR C-terminal-related transcriptional regulator [Dermatobacter hominis]UDY35007.1 helix-turn-helix transcriptional regulator [Dermatobacter hominis]